MCSPARYSHTTRTVTLPQPHNTQPHNTQPHNTREAHTHTHRHAHTHTSRTHTHTPQLFFYMVQHLKGLTKLRFLTIEGNPLEFHIIQFRFFLIAELPQLKYLDWEGVCVYVSSVTSTHTRSTSQPRKHRTAHTNNTQLRPYIKQTHSDIMHHTNTHSRCAHANSPIQTNSLRHHTNTHSRCATHSRSNTHSRCAQGSTSPLAKPRNDFTRADCGRTSRCPPPRLRARVCCVL